MNSNNIEFIYGIRDKETRKIVSRKCNKDKFYTMKKMAENKIKRLNEQVIELNTKMGRPNDTKERYELVTYRLEEVKE